MSNLIAASEEELVSVDDIGERIAQSLVNFFKDQSNLDLINRLASSGVQMENESVTLASNALEGKSIVVSGVFESISRNELKELIEQHGGKVSSSISSKTSFIVAGEGMGPSKKAKAEKLNIEIKSESSFLSLL
jgi:DNA ligase (NAD+)